MSYPPYCVLCGNKAHWNADFSCEDYCFDVDGIVGVYTCSSCSVMHYVIDVFLDESDTRLVKYTFDDDSDDLIEENNICNCLICGSNLDVTSTSTINKENILIKDSPLETCLVTELTCSNCLTEYTVLDSEYDDELSIYEKRTIILD